MDELFEFQVSPTLLSDFLVIKSGGEQISKLSPVITPVIDAADFVYRPTQGYFVFTSGITQTMTLVGGAGFYRFKGMATMSGVRGLTQDYAFMYLTTADALITVPLTRQLAAGSALFNDQGHWFDVVVELTDVQARSGINIILNPGVGLVGVGAITSELFLTAQRVK